MATKSRAVSVDLNSVFEGAASQFRGLNPNEPGPWPLLVTDLAHPAPWAGAAGGPAPPPHDGLDFVFMQVRS